MIGDIRTSACFQVKYTFHSGLFFFFSFAKHCLQPGDAFPAQSQSTALVRGQGHRLRNAFAWSYRPSILMTPVENATSHFASQFPIIAQMIRRVVIKKT